MSQVAHSVSKVRANPSLTLEEKRAFHRDGYFIVRGAVSPDLVEAARRRIKAAQKGESLMNDAALTDLVNASSIAPILHEVMGKFDPPTACQVGILKRREPGQHFNSLGYRDCDMPYFGAEMHQDGNITINSPQAVQEGAPDEIYRRHFASGPSGPPKWSRTIRVSGKARARSVRSEICGWKSQASNVRPAGARRLKPWRKAASR